MEHFAELVAPEIGGRAKAMIVTRSRLHAVRTKLALDRYLDEKGHPWKALVAFSGTVKDGGQSYTESGMNSAGQERVIGERQTAAEFDKPEYRFLVVANKFQTGFDQPLLHTMYVDKKLGGVNAVQTLSRLNRTHPGKHGTMVLDFANEPDEIQKAFEPYYETTLLSEETDPNLLYELQGRLLDYGVFAAADIETFAPAYFGPKATQDRIYAALEPARQRFAELVDEEARDFLGQLTDYVRLYAFLSQVLTFADTDLEKLYQFARRLRRLLSVGREALPLEVQQNIDMESFRIQRTSRGRLALERQVRPLDPAGSKPGGGAGGEQLEALSRIIEGLNERFGLNLTDEHRVTLERIRSALDQDAGLTASARVNTRENVRLTFDPKVEDKIQEIVETNFDLYKRITDDPDFGQDPQGPPVRGLHQATPASRGTAQAPGVEDARVQVEPALEPEGGPQGRQVRHPRGTQDHRRLPQHRRRRPPDRRRRRPQSARHRPRPPGERRQVHAAPGPGRAERSWRPCRHVH